MAVRRISPVEARSLVEQGYTYLDVRSVPEYEAGHPAGAHNIPLMHSTPGGMRPNAEFLPIVEKSYAKDRPLVIGCQAGGRSQRAALMLESAGYTDLLEMRGGYGGEADMTGKLVEKGWASVGLPIETRTSGGSWDELHRAAAQNT